ncbi:hypothetical protein NliqN6_1208 [Naganishia liquefaciens]|uniref:BTB domain-containing protein n=1 Tax=Naganishia liquefaciens TaxID=104408 RepID=A0A8H3YEI9_9TREE|nr:hypothetical protein NliqN6_1208 [Naganishia liquefaciens]
MDPPPPATPPRPRTQYRRFGNLEPDSATSSPAASPILNRRITGFPSRLPETPPRPLRDTGLPSQMTPRRWASRIAAREREYDRLMRLPSFSSFGTESEGRLGQQSTLAQQRTEEWADFQNWTTNHVEWCCRNLSDLLQESSAAPNLERSALLGKVIPDTKFRIDVVLSPQSMLQSRDAESLLEELSLEHRTGHRQELSSSLHFTTYVAPAHMAASCEELRSDHPISADIFLGIKPNNVAPGPQEGQDRWLWSTQETFVFTDDFTFWEAKLPPISELLQDQTIGQRDCFTLVLRLQTPATFPSTLNSREKRLVDKNLLTGLKSLLDDANTGDIQLICLEREAPYYAISDNRQGPPTSPLVSVRYRRRVLYAHSSIIKQRCEYLSDWIHFSSTESPAAGSARQAAASLMERCTHKVTCLDVDFATMYWFLHFLYTGELDFKDEEDVLEYDSLDSDVAQELILGINLGDPWSWRSVAVDQEGTMKVVRTPTLPRMSDRSPEDSTRSHASAKSAQSVTSAAAVSPTPQVKTGAFNTESPEGKVMESSTRTRPSSASSSATLQTAMLSRTRSSPTTPQTTSSVRSRPVLDPHAHPAEQLPPASAFAIYALAHRYQLNELSRLAQNHLLTHLKPETSPSLLLASYRFQDLHLTIEDYVIAHWEAVQSSAEFLRAIQDIATGS